MSSNKQFNRKRRQRAGRSLSISHNNRASWNSLNSIGSSVPQTDDLPASNSTNHRITNQYQF